MASRKRKAGEAGKTLDRAKLERLQTKRRKLWQRREDLDLKLLEVEEKILQTQQTSCWVWPPAMKSARKRTTRKKK